MKASMMQLAQRRAALVELSRQQRALLGAQFAQLGGMLHGVDHGLRLARIVRAHPIIALAVAAPILLYRPRRTLRWIGRAVTLVSFGRRLFQALRAQRH